MQELKKIRTVGCFFEHNGKILILLRNPEKSQGNHWGLPAGKAKKNESDENTILRELKEETGYSATKEELHFINEWTWKFKDITVEFPLFKIELKEKPKIILNKKEHQDYQWISYADCYNIPNLIHGFHDLLEIMRFVPFKRLNYEHSAGVVLFRNNTINNKEVIREYLLLKYTSKPIYWGLAKGHIENGENALEAAIRESEEETGLKNIKIIKKHQFHEEINYFLMVNGKLTYKEVQFFLGEVFDKFDGTISYEHEDIGWFTYEDVIKKITYHGDKQLIVKAEELLNEIKI